MTVTQSPPRKQKLTANILLRASGHTQHEFADFAGYSAAWVWRVLSGREPAPDKFKADLSRYLNIEASLLFPGEQDVA